MLFNRNDKITNEKTIYQTKPNMLLGCKKAIFGVILLVVVLSVASPIIAFIGEMQVYLISYVKSVSYTHLQPTRRRGISCGGLGG